MSQRNLVRIAVVAVVAAMSGGCLQLFQVLPHKKWGFITNQWVFLHKDVREAIYIAGAWANSFSEGLAAVMQ